MPERALIQLVERCNFGCSHCSQSAPLAAGGRRPGHSLGTADAKELLRKLHDVGVRRVRFTGGDPFLHEDLEGIARFACSLGIAISFVTNGWLLSEWSKNRVRELQAAPSYVSLYGFTEDAHDGRCGRSGAWWRAWGSVDLLVRSGVAVGLYVLVVPGEASGLDVLLARARSYGVNRIKLLQVLSQGRARRGVAPDGLSEDELVGLIRSTRSTADRGPKVLLAIRGSQLAILRREEIAVPGAIQCRMGLQEEWTVSADGQILPCCLYLERGRRAPFELNDEDLWRTWSEWSVERSIRWATGERVQRPEELRHCPAMGNEDAEGCFACPLTFVEL